MQKGFLYCSTAVQYACHSQLSSLKILRLNWNINIYSSVVSSLHSTSQCSCIKDVLRRGYTPTFVIIITLPTEFLICRMPDVGTISCFTFNIQEYDLVATPSRSNCSTWWLIQHWIRGEGGPSYTETHGVEHSLPRIRSNFRKYFWSELWTAPAGVARWQDGKNLVISLFLGKCKLLSSC